MINAPDEITFRKGDRLWSLIALIYDTHIDDLDGARLAEIETMISCWRVTHADGTPLRRAAAPANAVRGDHTT